MSSSNNSEKSVLWPCKSGTTNNNQSRYNSSTTAPPEDSTARLDQYNRQLLLDMQNNNNNNAPMGSPSTTITNTPTATAECRLFINPNVYSDYAIGRYIDDTSQTRTISSATSTAALGQDSWTWHSVSPFGHGDLVRSVSGGCGSDNASVDRQSNGTSSHRPPGKFQLLRSKFMQSRRNKLNRLSNKIAETTEGGACIRAENGFQRVKEEEEELGNKRKMQPQTVVASVVVPPKVKPKVSKVAKGPARGGGASGISGGGGVGDINDPMMRRPRRRTSSMKQRKELDPFAESLVAEQTWYLHFLQDLTRLQIRYGCTREFYIYLLTLTAILL